MGVTMNMSTIDPEVIQYILALLNIPPYRSTDDGQAHDTLIVRQIIRFMDEMPGGFFIYHADGDEKLIFANQAMLRIFQCETLDEFRALTGNSFRGIVHPDDLEEVEQSIQEQIAASQYDLDYIEYRITRKDGSVRWLEDYGHFIRNISVGEI